MKCLVKDKESMLAFYAFQLCTGDTFGQRKPITVVVAKRHWPCVGLNPKRRIRWSHELNTRLDTLDRHAQQIRSRQHFKTEVATGNGSLDLVKHPLYPYPQEGMLCLAFTGRALLADEMGLEKLLKVIENTGRHNDFILFP